MLPLAGKQIVLGVTGSIAAYKSADLVRRLGDTGAEVRVVMTKSACEFITPLTLQTLSGHPVALDLSDADQESAMGHITLARWADWILIAPASADVIARLAQGRADDLLSALSLASESPLAIAPAMNNKMWSNQATKANLELLRSRGVQVLGPASGDQACGEQGEGRLLEPVDIVAEMQQLLVPKKLQGKRVLITAGPTFESIDPVRFIGNRSSGKMGFAVAQAAIEAGAEVTLIAGPVHLATPTGVNRIDVETAQVMYEKVMDSVGESDIFISCAAVADYRPVELMEKKIKKTEQDSLSIELEPTHDIVADVAQQEDKPFVVGFAAETQDVATYARGKLEKKNLKMIIANDVSNTDIGFNSDSNSVTVFWGQNQQDFPRMSKSALSNELIELIAHQYTDTTNSEKI